MLGKGFAAERKSRFTKDEQKTMMTLWCIFKSPLMLGSELTLLDEETKSLITNEEVLSLLKNGSISEQVRRDEKSCVWKSGQTIALFNLSDKEGKVSVTFEELGMEERAYKIRDLWEKRDIEKISGKSELAAVIPAHGAKLLSVICP